MATPIRCPRCSRLTFASTIELQRGGPAHALLKRYRRQVVWVCAACGYRPTPPRRVDVRKLF